ncbi:uncharacterized protein LOC119603686 [Lucilia sericata]|uniref:uncharacterized protein LOC119603686 n=1 Tax=Lucilia sericata TaxID=13632 RepID=UPI0018A8597F|nr:uncharacterized protein LOC119603686 [Lucilia sericata]
MSSILTDEQRNILIDVIRERRILYDTNDPNYKNITCKRRAWKDIAKLCKAQETACKIVWKSMRDQYQRYMRSPTNKRKQFRYLSKLSFLEGFTKHTKNKVIFCNDAIEHFVDNSSNSSNHKIFYKNESEDYNEDDYSEEITKCYNNSEESEHEEITSEPTKKFDTLPQTTNDPIYCENYYANNTNTDGNEDVIGVEKSANNVCDSISNFLAKYIKTDEDDNDLFLKMLGKKMKALPLTVRNRLQERFLKDVNDEIGKIN